VTYLITGMPVQLLVSAVYLMTLRPEATVRFWSADESPEPLWRDWERVDFVFAPESALPALRPPRLDLAIDIMAMRLMSRERMVAHVQRAYELGAPYFYSLLPSDEAAATSSAIWTSIEQRFWPHPIPARADRIIRPVDLDGNPPIPSDCAHLVGWKRLPA
jgi:hypothetical protein